MLEGTRTTVRTMTDYEIPGNTIVIPMGGYEEHIRPTQVSVVERDGEIISMTFTGPRQLPGPTDARDTSTRVVVLDNIPGPAADELVSEVLMLHLRNTVKVLSDDETREVLASLPEQPTDAERMEAYYRGIERSGVYIL